MTPVLAFLFIFFAIVLGAGILRSFLGADPMPLACPRCNAASTRGAGGSPIRWYRLVRYKRLRCRSCQTAFREHPNGLLVEDRDDYD